MIDIKLGIILLILSSAITLTGLLMLFTPKAHAATARFTGQFTVERTSNGRSALNCQYQAGGQYYWFIVTGSRCPLSMPVP